MHHQFILLLVLVFISPKLTLAQTSLSRFALQDSLKQTTVDSNKLKFILNICDSYNRDQKDSLIKTAKEGVLISKKHLDFLWGRNYYQKFISKIGHTYRQQRKFELSKTTFQELITIGINKKDSTLISDGYSDLAYLYSDEGLVDSTIIYDLKALQIRKQIKSPKLGKSYNNLGYDYKKRGSHKKALFYYLKAVEYKKRYNSSKDIGNSYMNVGNIYQKIHKLDSTLYYFNLALDHAKKLKDSSFIAEVQHSFGMTYSDLGDSILAKKYLLEAMYIFKQLNQHNSPRVVNTYHELAKTHLSLKEFNEAEVLLLKSEQILLDNNKAVSDYMKINFKTLEQLYWEKTDFIKARVYVQKSYKLQDTLHAIERNQKATDLLAKYEDELKEERIKNLEKEQQISDLEKEKLNSRLYILSATILVMLLILVFLYRLNKWRSKVNLELETLNNTKDKLFSIIAHDLKNPLSAFRSITQSLSDDIFDISREDLDYFMKQLNNSAHNLFDLLQNLLYWSISQSGRLEFQPQKITPTNTTEDVFNLLKSSADIKKITLNNTISIDTTAWADQKMTHTILRNLVANAIKFTPNNGNITVSAVVNHSVVTISVADTGKGITPEIAKNLFLLGSNKNKRNETEGKGTGLGLILCKELVEQQDGKIRLETTSAQGSIFSFTLPVHPKKA